MLVGSGSGCPDGWRTLVKYHVVIYNISHMLVVCFNTVPHNCSLLHSAPTTLPHHRIPPASAATWHLRTIQASTTLEGLTAYRLVATHLQVDVPYVYYSIAPGAWRANEQRAYVASSVDTSAITNALSD